MLRRWYFKLTFTPCKIGSFFNLKDLRPQHLLSNVVYKFTCASCNASYIGETARHFSTRVNEHLKTDKASHVYKHVNELTECFDNCTADCFSILDTVTTKYQLKIKDLTHLLAETLSQ